jgi:fatty acid desaturase
VTLFHATTICRCSPQDRHTKRSRRFTTVTAAAPWTDIARNPETETASGTRRGSEYAELSRRVKAAGLLQIRPRRYAARFLVNTVMLVGGAVAFVLLGDSWWQMLTAVFFAVVFTQFAFVGHDVGHRQVFRSRGANEITGLLHGNLLIGLSFSWWVDKHNRHHSHPNEVDRDPDVGAGVFVWTPEQAQARTGFARGWTRYQKYSFFPMLLLEAVSLHVSSVQALKRRDKGGRWVEAALLGCHAAGYAVALLLVLSPLRAAVFAVIHQGLFGLYLGCSFAPNHKGMPMFMTDESPDFLRRQVLTSRNVRGGWFADFVFGGLNYQIEHHLFPSMPRVNLRRSQPVVRAFCAERGLPYAESGALSSYAQALAHLGEAAAPLRAEPADAP